MNMKPHSKFHMNLSIGYADIFDEIQTDRIENI